MARSENLTKSEPFWFADNIGGSLHPAGTEPDILADRAEILIQNGGGNSVLNWEESVLCGVVKDRSGYLSLLREVCIRFTKNRLAGMGDLQEKELIHLVRLLTEIDYMSGSFQERIDDYGRVLKRGTDNEKSSCSEKSGKDLSFAHSVQMLLKELDNLKGIRKEISNDISKRAEELMPNSTVLAGPLVAARLLERAGGLSQLSRLPASSLQVLGAENALFSHLIRGAPSPKHGIIYQHKRVHVSRKRSRGKVSRVFACRLSIAARIDFYRKERDEEFIKKTDEMIQLAGERR